MPCMLPPCRHQLQAHGPKAKTNFPLSDYQGGQWQQQQQQQQQQQGGPSTPPAGAGVAGADVVAAAGTADASGAYHGGAFPASWGAWRPGAGAGLGAAAAGFAQAL
jgi:hypothetical protein